MQVTVRSGISKNLYGYSMIDYFIAMLVALVCHESKKEKNNDTIIIVGKSEENTGVMRRVYPSFAV